MRMLFLLALALAGEAAAAEKLNTIAAIVNNDSISRLEIDRLAAETRRQSAARGETLDETQSRKQALDALIFRALQLQQARRLGVQIPEQMMEQRLAALREQFGAANNIALRTAVRDNLGLPWEEFYRRLQEDLEIEAVFYGEVFSKTDVYEEEVEQFLRAESGLVGKNEYHLRHLRLDGKESREFAAELRERVLADKTAFAPLARTYSSAEDAEDGGDLGWRGEEQLPAPFVAAVRELEPGQISDVIETGRGFHLLQLLDVRGGESAENASQVRISHIFLDLEEEEELADDLHSRLSAGEDFAVLARRHSRDERSADKGGDLGWFPVGGLPDYFAPVRKMAEGEISAPLVSPFGIHLVRLEKHEAVDMDAARENAREILRERRALAQRLDWLNQLRNRAYIVIVDPEFGDLIDDDG